MQPLTYTLPLQPGGLYHIYNRGNNFQEVFKRNTDYTSFLNKWREYIHPVAKTLAYCLLPNHFHAIVQVREFPDTTDLASLPSGLAKSTNASRLISRGFTNFFISFSRTMQNRYGFQGAVFHSPFKRKAIGNNFYLDYAIAYVHCNPLKHHLFSGVLEDYAHSSYRALISEAPTLLERDFVLNYFGGLGKFKAYHHEMAEAFRAR